MADDTGGQPADHDGPPRWSFAAAQERASDFFERWWPVGLALAALDLGAYLIRRVVDGLSGPWPALPLGVVLVAGAVVGLVTWRRDTVSWAVPYLAYWVARTPLRDSTTLPWTVSEGLLPGLVALAVYYGRKARHAPRPE